MAKKIKGVSSSMDDGLDDAESLPPMDDLETSFGPKDAPLDLDKYGIWVKAEPEDFKEKASFDDKDLGLTDLSPDEEGDLPSAGLELEAAPDTGMIDNLDIPEEESLPVMEEAGGGQEVSLDEELPSLDESLSFDEPESGPETETVVREEAAVAPEPEFGEPVEGAGGGDFQEVSLDDLGIEISEEVPADELAGKKAPARKPAPAPAPARAPEPEEHDSHVIDDEFAALPLELEAEGETAGESAADDELVMEDLALPEEESVAEETMAFDIEEEPAGAGQASAPAADEEVLEEIPELELGADEGVELDLGDGAAADEIEVPLSETISIPEAEEELETIDAGAGSAAAGTAGGSPELFRKIEAELRSIKSELTQLKSEIGVLRGRKPAAASETTGPRRAGKGDGDFFEEEEDETIALTGEELDNILTTADIKEEEKAAPSGEPAEDAALDLGEDIITYEEPTAESVDAATSEEPAVDLAEAPAEEISFAEMETDTAEDAGLVPASADDIEIEIPDLDGGGGEVPDLEMQDDLESLEELSPGEAAADVVEDFSPVEPEPAPPARPSAKADAGRPDMPLPTGLKDEIKSVLGYMDHLLESLPEEKIEEFAKSEYFAIYKKLFEELGLVS